MDFKKYLPQLPMIIVSGIAVILTTYNLLSEAAGDFVPFLVFGAVAVYATISLINKLKTPVQ